ncbi:MAG: hypothetical protein M1819_003164 [Sarea resinae]|nr:MAG: hypothetical protein M1819_003164 [Sarea resinae]
MASRFDRRGTDCSDSSMSSAQSDSSDHSRSTAPTHYSTRPSLQHYETAVSTLYAKRDGGDHDFVTDPKPTDSYGSYAASVPSIDDERREYPVQEAADYRQEAFTSEAVPSTPPCFADLFPSSRRLLIRHDDSTEDGNMNLRVDTEVPISKGRNQDITLFHLRMHDLKEREFSLRRYCRDSGREVCHTAQKYQRPAVKRPSLHRSVSYALASLRSKSENKTTTLSSLKRQDSGYDSMSEEEDESKPKSKPMSVSPTNTIKLEFSNYAQVDVKRRGTKISRHYDFEYWGYNYTWKRETRKDGDFEEVSFHLIRGGTAKSIAHIVPEPLTPAQAREESAKGGWVPPCSMWISDPEVFGGLTDVADIIVATGLVSLVDDSIKRRFQQKRSLQLVLPVPMKTPFKKNVDYIGPKRLIDEVFNRRSSALSSRQPTPLRQASYDA